MALPNYQIVRGVFRFMYNLPSGFIEDIWGHDEWLAKRLREKFDSICSDAGGYASGSAILKFAGGLDEMNALLFYQYILKYTEQHG